jgi:hypothetical protein
MIWPLKVLFNTRLGRLCEANGMCSGFGAAGAVDGVRIIANSLAVLVGN